MGKLLASRSAQYLLTQEFAFNYNDYATDSVDGVKKTFGSTTVMADPSGSVSGLTAGTGIVLDAIPMPQGAVIVGGEMVVESAYAGIGAGATVALGVAGDTASLLASTDLDAAAAGSRTALLLTKPLVCNGGTDIRLTIAGMAATATAGKVRIRVMYTIDGRANENQIT